MMTPKKSLSEYTFDQFSTDSLEVLNHYGIEAPTILNEYALSLEDALLDAQKEIKILKQQIKELQE